MSRYSIEGSTLTAIGDAIRNKTGKLTRIDTFPVEQNTFIVPVHPENIDVTQLSDKDSYGNTTQYWHYTQDIVVPGAVKFQVNYTFDTNLADSYAVYAFKEDGKTDTTSVYCNPGGTTNGNIIKTYHNKVRISVNINKDYWEQKNYSYCDFEIIGLDADGNPVTEYEAEVVDTITPLEMAAEIDNMQVLPEEGLIITGNVNNRFSRDGWNWFLNAYKDKLVTKDITDASLMFYSSAKLEEVPFDINVTQSCNTVKQMFYGCTNLKSVPKIKGNPKINNTSGIFYNCAHLKEIPEDFYEDWDWSPIDNATSSYTGDRTQIFQGCSRLIKYPNSFLAHGNPVSSGSYAIYKQLFSSCYSLKEIVDLPIVHRTGKWTSNVFYDTFDNTSHLRKLTFETNEDGSPIKIDTWSKQTIELNAYTGYFQYDHTPKNNTDIPTDKQVKDDATYAALKDDPDWWTANVDYSRYNHDSAVETVNTLPDLSGGAGGNTIKFKGVAGALTDGGAINTLTEEEIAVAAAKGWTVSLV